MPNKTNTIHKILFNWTVIVFVVGLFVGAEMQSVGLWADLWNKL
jgi:hypothetical protein